jgi:Na+/melibiose symporter-like transporter
MSFTVITAAAPFIAVDLLGGKTSHVALLLGPFLLSALLTFVFVPRIGARLGIERAMLFAALLLGIVYASSGLLGVSLIGSPLTTAMCLFAAAGPMAAVILGLEGEAVAAAAARQPDNIVSLYFGVVNLFVKALNGLALSLTGILAARVPTLGAEAVRPMSFLAGGLLVVGVALYSVVRKRQSPSTS